MFLLKVILLSTASTLTATASDVSILDCSKNAEPGLAAGSYISDFHFEPLRNFTICFRFIFMKLDRVSVVFNVRDVGTRPAFQIEVDVNRLRIVIARQYKYVYLEDWLRPDHWYHVCIAKNENMATNSSVEIFVDGQIIEKYGQNLKINESIGSSLTVCYVDPQVFPDFKFSGKISQLNFWRRVLNPLEVEALASCQADSEGDLIPWSVNWLFQNSSSYSTDLKTLCEKDQTSEYSLFHRVTFYEAAHLCEGIGGHLFIPASLEDVSRIYSWAKTNELEAECRLMWVGIWNPDDVADVWEYRVNGSKVSNTLPWVPDEPNGAHFENCGGLEFEGIVDDGCEAQRCPLCQLPKHKTWTLEGSCEKYKHNEHFLREDLEDGFQFRGYGSYVIKKKWEDWIWFDARQNVTIAVLKPTNYNFPYGRQNWELHQSVCDQTSGVRRLLLTTCDRGEFTCDDGTCIPHSERCDQKYDCRDNTDEAHCTLIKLPDDYKSNVVPRDRGRNKEALEVTAVINIETLMVETTDMVLDITFNLGLSWIENRATYINLKNDSSLNFVEGTNNSLWSPDILFKNANKHSTTENDDSTSTFIIKKEQSLQRDISIPEFVQMFPGARNPVERYRKYQVSFTCDFELTGYPFDSQTCVMHLVLRSGTKDVIKFSNQSTVFYTGNALLREYAVGRVKVASVMEGKQSELKILIPLDRLHGYAFINIYLPSFTMLIIGFLTLFFKDDIFEVRVMTALTTLLVTTTLFSQVASSLPKTSSFKTVDIWLLCCIFSTFFVIVFHILIDWSSPSAQSHKSQTLYMKKSVSPEKCPPVIYISPTDSADSRKAGKTKVFTESERRDCRCKCWLLSLLSSIALGNKDKMKALGRYFVGFGFLLFNLMYWLIIYGKRN